jgi:hypothetical protein
MSPSATDTHLELQILHVPDCPNVEDMRRRIERALTTLGLSATVAEIEGSFPSPTLLVNGTDVIPRPDAPLAACRLDLPSEAQIFAALSRATGNVGGAGGNAESPDRLFTHLGK